MRSLSVATSDELNEGSFLGTGGFDESGEGWMRLSCSGLNCKSGLNLAKMPVKSDRSFRMRFSLKNAGDKASLVHRSPNQSAARYSLSSVCQFAGTAPAGPGVG
jgi:hypothetical protein